jgi:hypothetical protein
MYDMQVSRLDLAPQVVEYGPMHRKARGSSGMMGILPIVIESRRQRKLSICCCLVTRMQGKVKT